VRRWNSGAYTGGPRPVMGRWPKKTKEDEKWAVEAEMHEAEARFLSLLKKHSRNEGLLICVTLSKGIRPIQIT
jgi:hypothetical protein